MRCALLSESGGDTSSIEGTADHSAFMSRNSGHFKKKKGRCYNCGDKTHIKPNCPLLRSSDFNSGKLGCSGQSKGPKSKPGEPRPKYVFCDSYECTV